MHRFPRIFALLAGVAALVPASSQADDEIRHLAGQWLITYDGGAIRVYSFDNDGKMRGRVDNLQLTGQIEKRDDRLLLTINEEDKLERFTLRADGQLAVEHFFPKADFPDKAPATVGLGMPVTGKNPPGVEVLDVRMVKALRDSGGSAATLTVTREWQTLYSRGYGWSDREHKVRLHPDNPMIIASCDKPLTAAAIRQLARHGKLDLNASILKFLNAKPAGEVVDPRMWDITIQHVLDHKAGWQGEPTLNGWQAYNGRTWPLESFEGLLGCVMVQKLAWAPGEKSDYDNFGYNMLKTVVAKASGRSYVDYLRHELLRPYGIQELEGIRHGERRKGEPPQLWNGLIMEDPKEYRMGVSTPALCAIMRHFWEDGKTRHKGNQFMYKTGACDGSAQMTWRTDGINVAWTFNSECAPVDLWDKAIDWLIEQHKLPRPPKSK
jgi:CubicO group peptidase (beta-lactamase class C family)